MNRDDALIVVGWLQGYYLESETDKIGARVGELFRKKLEALGLKRKGVCFHSFRHTVAGRLEAAGLSEGEAARITGCGIELNIQTPWKRPVPPARPTISARTSYRLDSRHCTGGAKDSGEHRVALRQRKTTAPSCDQGNPDQLAPPLIDPRRFHLARFLDSAPNRRVYI